MKFDFALARAAMGSAAAAIVLVAACSSDATPGVVNEGEAGVTKEATCANPGVVTPGAPDSHCGGKYQAVVASSCTDTDAGTDDSDAGAGDDDNGCDYGATMYGTSGNDDDCKYLVSYTNDPICEGAGGVKFTVTVKNAIDGTPVDVTGGLVIEAFIPSTPNPTCDDQSTHPSPTISMPETSTPGVYSGPIVFDAAGTWTVRFHIHEECADVLDTSPHGHAAFHITVP